MSGSGADVAANEIFEELMEGVSLPTIPAVDLSGVNFQLPAPGVLDDALVKLTNDDLTTKVVNGTGTFDVLMQALRAHLQKEFESNRITGEQYAKVYVGLTEGAMAQAVQFLIQRDASYWQAITAQQQALAAQAQVITARVQLEAAKVQLATISVEHQLKQAEYALTKLKLATEDKAYGAAAFNLQYLLPQQEKLLKEQTETARAQTMDTRSDGITNITGAVGKQKALYTQQITSYQRDSEVKAGKIFVDAWTVMKTIDEGLLPPTGFNNTTLDAILTTLKTANGL
jgi:hypothetical protein